MSDIIPQGVSSIFPRLQLQVKGRPIRNRAADQYCVSQQPVSVRLELLVDTEWQSALPGEKQAL